jgi:hypothetical protein
MNSTPFDSLSQRDSLEANECYLAYSILEKFAKKQKTNLFGSHIHKWGLWPELSLYLNSTRPILISGWF